MNWKEKLDRNMRKFLVGRYGVMDQLNRGLLLISVGLIFLSIIFPQRFLTTIALLILAVSYYRIFSKKISRRYKENQRYLEFIRPVQRFYHLQMKKIKERKEYRYVKCPECHKTTRVPKNRGKIVITCPNCHHKFEKTT
ncbi:MAG: hypothetical protein ACTIDE_06880 [Carnobacterium maltaromaticum]|uniref:hypothetical protein n=1 Tax=Carnobacterium maltaromaticum TaxID=2751 RepID=UPI00191BA818|nr:hypothetical protein [Carnobacterium maltaromaticum]CAD5897317.1 conserved hypothetical protein [Carnobacterium maltaromaticum]